MPPLDDVVCELAAAGFLDAGAVPAVSLGSAASSSGSGSGGCKGSDVSSAVARQYDAVRQGVAAALSQWRRQGDLMQRLLLDGEETREAASVAQEATREARDQLLSAQARLQRCEEDTLELQAMMRQKATAAAEEASRQEARLKAAQEKLAVVFCNKRAYGHVCVFFG